MNDGKQWGGTSAFGKGNDDAQDVWEGASRPQYVHVFDLEFQASRLTRVVKRARKRWRQSLSAMVTAGWICSRDVFVLHNWRLAQVNQGEWGFSKNGSLGRRLNVSSLSLTPCHPQLCSAPFVELRGTSATSEPRPIPINNGPIEWYSQCNKFND